MRTPQRRAFGLATALMLSLAAAPTVLGQDGAEVIISDALEPARLEVSAGTVVTWHNEDDERHRIRSREGPVEFDSGNLEPGEGFSVTLIVAGEYPYLDERNDEDPAYFGTVVVVDDQATGGPPPPEATVTLIDESFQPSTIDVAVGATVTWQNVDGDDDHTVTSTGGAFNSDVLPAGSTFEHTFAEPGTYPYLCAIHPEMQGTVNVVGDAPSGSPTASASPAPVASPVPVSSPSAAPAPGTDGSAVSIVGLAFEPAAVEVAVGTTITWTNEDGFDHTVTASGGEFNSGVMSAGATFSQAFAAAGVFEYLCAIHPTMTGVVTVTP